MRDSLHKDNIEKIEFNSVNTINNDVIDYASLVTSPWKGYGITFYSEDQLISLLGNEKNGFGKIYFKDGSSESFEWHKCTHKYAKNQVNLVLEGKYVHIVDATKLIENVASGKEKTYSHDEAWSFLDK